VSCKTTPRREPSASVTLVLAWVIRAQSAEQPADVVDEDVLLAVDERRADDGLGETRGDELLLGHALALEVGQMG
jgi:hypothetical protein